MSDNQARYYAARFKRMLIEDMTAGAGGAFGDTGSMGFGGAIGNTDFYAPGDMRIPTPGKKTRKSKKPKKKERKNNKSENVGSNLLIPMQRRPLTKSL